jgi:hypothetical protein
VHFLKEINCFEELNYHNTCSKCLPSACKQTSGHSKRFFDTSLSSLILLDVILSQMLCLSLSAVWRLFEYTLYFMFPHVKITGI